MFLTIEGLVFLVILFGLFGVVATQYLNQYRSAYDIWVNEIIFGKNREPNEKLDLCSKIEAYSRELCGITDVLCILLFMLYITLFVNIVSSALIMNYMNFNIHTNFANLTNSDKIDFIQTVVPLALTMLVFFAMPFLLLLLNLNNIHKHKVFNYTNL